MVTSPGEIYISGLEFATSVVDRFPSAGWEGPSPCAGWRALDVLGHLGATTQFGTRLLEGAATSWQPPSIPGQMVEGEPASWWRDLALHALEVARGVDLDRVVDTPAGRRSVGAGLTFPAVDLYVHSWDLARSGGFDVEIPAEAIEFSRSVLERIPEEQLRRPATFAPPAHVSGELTPTGAFVAWTGRDPEWAPPRS